MYRYVQYIYSRTYSTVYCVQLTSAYIRVSPSDLDLLTWIGGSAKIDVIGKRWYVLFLTGSVAIFAIRYQIKYVPTWGGVEGGGVRLPAA